MEKKIKINFKKIFAIFTLIILLQNYAVTLGNIAIAIENKMFDFKVSGNSDFIEMIQDKKENIEVGNTTRRSRRRGTSRK